MATKRQAVELDQLAAHLESWVAEQIQIDSAVLRDQVAAEVANRTLAEVALKSTTVASDTGEYARGWEAQPTDDGWDGWDVFNTVPYSGVIELGRRPMRPGPPLAPILEYVRRKDLGGSDEANERIARALREKIHRNGTPPKHILGDTVEAQWDRWLSEAVAEFIQGRRR